MIWWSNPISTEDSVRPCLLVEFMQKPSVFQPRLLEAVLGDLLKFVPGRAVPFRPIAGTYVRDLVVHSGEY